MKPYKDRRLDVTKPVYVYRNLHTHNFSIYQQEVKAHTNTLILSNVTFHVSEKGRQRVINQKRKNVHAKVKGVITNLNPDNYQLTPIYYNPYTTEQFTINNQPIYQTDLILLKDNKMYKMS